MAVVVALACSSAVALAADRIRLGLLEDASGNVALATIPKIHATELAVGEPRFKTRTWRNLWGCEPTGSIR
jgi:branched-chain amino acid transport system substrate-binding protein